MGSTQQFNVPKTVALCITVARDGLVLFYWLYVATHIFTFVDISQYGSTKGSSVLNKAEMGKAFEDGCRSLLEPQHLPGPYVSSFVTWLVTKSLKPWLMYPNPGTTITEDQIIFNYRLCRERTVIENCFGILLAR